MKEIAYIKMVEFGGFIMKQGFIVIQILARSNVLTCWIAFVVR